MGSRRNVLQYLRLEQLNNDASIMAGLGTQNRNTSLTLAYQ